MGAVCYYSYAEILNEFVLSYYHYEIIKTHLVLSYRTIEKSIIAASEVLQLCL